MNSTKQSKRASQNFDRAMRVAEHHSYANLTSSFEVPSVGRVPVPVKNNQLRVTKSFHGEISDVGGRLPNENSKGHQSGVGHSVALSNGFTLLRHPQTFASQRKIVDRQKTKVLQPLHMTKNQTNGTKLSDVSIGQEFSSAYLPESSTASYRLTHDIAFDEGSRYRNAALSTHNPYKMIDDSRDGTIRRKNCSTGDDYRANQAVKFDLLNDNSNKRPPTSHVQTLTFKEPISYSFLRVDDRRTASRVLSPYSGGISPTYTNSTSPNSASTFRGNKELNKASWNQRFGDLSISGGGFCGSSAIQAVTRTDNSNGYTSLEVIPTNSYSQKVGFRSLSREKNLIPSRPRYSSKTRRDSNTYGSLKDPAYADPCIGGPPSFHQRLNELSILEAETIKFEKARKFKRKSKSDKDS